ncbi:MAG: MFS transporter [Actinomycetota bacterium]
MWVLGFVLAVDSTDQSILRGVQTLIKVDFGLTDAAVGLVASAFVLVNALTTIPAGYLADRLNRKRVIGTTIIAWSGVTALTGAAANFAQLLGIRALLGFGLGITEPSANSLLTDYYPAQQRGRAFSIQQMMLFVGFGAGIGLGGAIGERLGWRWAFVLIGLPGVLTSILVFRLREPLRGHGDRLSMGIQSSLDQEPGEKAKLFEHGIATFASDLIRGLRDDVRTIAAIPTLRYALVGIGVLLFSVTGVGYWLPVYLERFLDLSVTESTAAVGGIVLIGGVSGTLVGGTLADRFHGRMPGGRIAIPAYCLMLGTVLFTISFLPIPLAAVLVLETLGLFAFTLAVPSLRAGVGDAVPADLRGAGFAAFSLISALSGAALAPPLLGALSDLTDLRIAFLICMPPIFLGALILLRARKHLDEDVAKVLVAVQRAYQEQMALEESRRAEESGSVEVAEPESPDAQDAQDEG